jgi:hypothetical protein
VLFVPTTLSTLTRPDEFSSGCRSTTRCPFIFKTLASFVPVKTSGPQSWCGEIESRSATETRYGTGSPQTSSADAVRPPEEEKKNVFATAPSYSTT